MELTKIETSDLLAEMAKRTAEAIASHTKIYLPVPQSGVQALCKSQNVIYYSRRFYVFPELKVRGTDRFFIESKVVAHNYPCELFLVLSKCWGSDNFWNTDDEQVIRLSLRDEKTLPFLNGEKPAGTMSFGEKTVELYFC